MRTRIAIILAIVFGLLLVASCSSPKGPTVNRLMVEDGWIYFTLNEENALYKMKTDGSERIKIQNGTGYMLLQDDVIYYFDGVGGISSVKTDGTDPMKIADVVETELFGFYVMDEWVYYPTKSGSVYKVKTDGSSESKIADLPSFNGDMQVYEEWIYYSDGNDLYKMKTDGSESSLLGENLALITIADDWIYYGEFTGNGDLGEEIYRMTLEGKENKKIVDGRYVELDEGHIYYTKKDVLYRANLDGTGEMKTSEQEFWLIFCIDDNVIYYGEYSGAAYKVDFDGNNKTRIE